MRRDDETWLIDGMVGLDELKQVLGISRLPGEDPDFHTLGGYLMARLNRVPMEADRISAGDWRFEVVKMDGRRVDRVLVTPVTGRNPAVNGADRTGPIELVVGRRRPGDAGAASGPRERYALFH